MRPTIHWLDRFRSLLTGHSASSYATRRLAREDLHALEAERARAVARLSEDLEILDRYVNPFERYMDGNRLIAPLGTILDRRSGKNLPLVWTELDLREFRRMARVICDVNPFAVGFLGLLTDFHLRQGFGWQAYQRGTRNPELRTELAVSTLIICQGVLDEWRNHQLWGLKSREAFRRWRRDGEVFLRFFRGGEGSRGLPVIRFVEPEQVGPPPGDDADGEWSFGVRTDPEDIEDVISYFVRDPLGTGSEGDEVPADRIIHLKANVDSSIKRGLPDFLPVQDDLERVRRILRNMGEVAAVQTAIAWVSQYASATAEQVGTLIRAGSDYTRPKLGSPSGKLMDVVRYEPGTVLHMDDNRQFVPGPVGTGTSGFIQVEQAILRGCGARWRMPEYFSGDASNNNLASSIVAGSPFVVAVEGTQLEWAAFERAVAMKVLELCVESGRLRPEDIADIDVKVIPPAVALANREEEEKLRQMRHEAGVLSVTTWQQQVGLDPKHEAANFAEEAKQRAALQSAKSGPGSAGKAESSCGCEDRVTEAERTGHHWFTGEIKDSLGRRRCYKDGKEIPCDKLAQTSATAGDPGNEEPKEKSPSGSNGGQAQHVQRPDTSRLFKGGKPDPEYREDPKKTSDFKERARQVGFDDCWLIAAAIGLAKRNPQAIKDMIKENGNSTYTVTFPGYPDKPVVVKESELDPNRMARSNGIWLAVIEKAYAELKFSEKSKVEKFLTGGKNGGVNHAAFAEAAVKPLTGNGMKPILLGDAGRVIFPEKDLDKLAKELETALHPTEGKEPRIVMAVTRPTLKQGVAALQDKLNQYLKTPVLFNQFNNDGLVPAHWYVGYKIKNLDGEWYTQLRNPWGRKGEYGMEYDKDGKITKMPPEKAGEEESDGIFSMSLKDFVKSFMEVEIEDADKAKR